MIMIMIINNNINNKNDNNDNDNNNNSNTVNNNNDIDNNNHHHHHKIPMVYHILPILDDPPHRFAACTAKATRTAGLIGRSWQQVAHLLRCVGCWVSPSDTWWFNG